MSDSSGDEDSTVTTDIYIPINPVSKKPLRWDGNDATIIGKLEETWKHYTRKGIFQELIAHRLRRRWVLRKRWRAGRAALYG